MVTVSTENGCPDDGALTARKPTELVAVQVQAGLHPVKVAVVQPVVVAADQRLAYSKRRATDAVLSTMWLRQEWPRRWQTRARTISESL